MSARFESLLENECMGGAPWPPLFAVRILLAKEPMPQEGPPRSATGTFIPRQTLK